jgi:hypothetical protein
VVKCWGYPDRRDSFTGIHTREIACYCIADRKIRDSKLMEVENENSSYKEK